MAIKVAINGYGRIGRNILRALYESGRTSEIQIVAINDLGDAETNAHLTQYDSAHGKFPGSVTAEGGFIIVNGDKIKVCAERDPSKLPWAELGVDVVLECTGLFRSKAKAGAHLAAGAKKVIISAPGADDIDGTFVFGVNTDKLNSRLQVISNASCTTNCLAPLAKVLNAKLGIVHGLMTTIHAYTNDQVLSDVYHADLRRARSATMSQIPTKTGAAAAVGLVLPELNGKLDGFSMRVPTINVSVVDLTFVAKRATTKEEIDAIINEAAHGAMQGIIEVNTKPLVSIDFNHNPASSIYDATQTRVMEGTLVKVLSWYDNEWGFSNRMLDITVALMAAK
ncbi:MAG: type I glyceraldehyde-3-phosphate dehydrogenase [Rhodanobacter sp.]